MLSLSCSAALRRRNRRYRRGRRQGPAERPPSLQQRPANQGLDGRDPLLLCVPVFGTAAPPDGVHGSDGDLIIFHDLNGNLDYLPTRYDLGISLVSPLGF
jgi:hypothetical protein